MKKLFYSLFMMALTAMTFTSCEDVPMPYDDPNKGGGGSTEPDIEIIGDGSAENPYNVASAIALFKSLASGAKSESMVYIKGKVSPSRNSTAHNMVMVHSISLMMDQAKISSMYSVRYTSVTRNTQVAIY